MIQFILSEWGVHTPFKNIQDAIKHCMENGLSDGKEGILWIKGTSRNEMTAWRTSNSFLIDHEYMRVMYELKGKKWEWCSIFKKWDAYAELQDNKLEFIN